MSAEEKLQHIEAKKLATMMAETYRPLFERGDPIIASPAFEPSLRHIQVTFAAQSVETKLLLAQFLVYPEALRQVIAGWPKSA